MRCPRRVFGTTLGPHIMRDGERPARLHTSCADPVDPQTIRDLRKCVTAIYWGSSGAGCGRRVDCELVTKSRRRSAGKSSSNAAASSSISRLRRSCWSQRKKLVTNSIRQHTASSQKRPLGLLNSNDILFIFAARRQQIGPTLRLGPKTLLPSGLSILPAGPLHPKAPASALLRANGLAHFPAS